jgi:hypothetical protein
VGAGESPGDELEDGPAESIRNKSGRGQVKNFVRAMEGRKIYRSPKPELAFSAYTDLSTY